MSDSDRQICLGMPGYGPVTPGAAKGFFRSSKSKNLNLQMRETSLLAHNFNLLWCWALNTAKKGQIDYFAMQHSDIEPEDYWLDKLIDELEARNLDVLGVVSPIKDTRGITSIALDREDGYTWKPHCRLSMSEIMRLPETFTSEDVKGLHVLLNTGLWVCKFDLKWASKVHFAINDRIVLDPEGNYVPEVESEDWYFSRLLHEQGLRIGCTRKVKLVHRGQMAFRNSVAWGTSDYDEDLLDRSILDPDLGENWFPHGAAGWLSEEEGRELARLAEGKIVLEVGSYCGRSTICLAKTAVAVTAVDTFDGRGTAAQGDTFPQFIRNLDRHGVVNKVRPVRADSVTVLPDLPPVYDLVFIDGDHSYESVKQDAELASRVLKPGGILAFHDYDSESDPGVTQAVDELLSGGAQLLGRCGSLAVIRPVFAGKAEPVGVA